ncbi:hypothetical protein M569_16982 [Genlisea aurea]|uniref:BHLH domain-containing protein n=1 Tax=Genlisea aurea TaxID=192259 RepID=S8BTF9_9LAMI|nr:hypothetical protein M569_16982 [Genlisea aurea]
MSSRRIRSRQSANNVVTRITDDQISDLVSRLQLLLPETRRRSDKTKENSLSIISGAC